jgi:hypothetical protein
LPGKILEEILAVLFAGDVKGLGGADFVELLDGFLG